MSALVLKLAVFFACCVVMTTAADCPDFGCRANGCISGGFDILIRSAAQSGTQYLAVYDEDTFECFIELLGMRLGQAIEDLQYVFYYSTRHITFPIASQEEFDRWKSQKFYPITRTLYVANTSQEYFTLLDEQEKRWVKRDKK